MTSPFSLPYVDARVESGSQNGPHADQTVGEVMLLCPKVLPSNAAVDQARAMLDDDHVHMVLVSDGHRLVGTLTRGDLPLPHHQGPAAEWSVLDGRTVSPLVTVAVAHRRMIEQGLRRLAVVGDGGALLGLLCLKRRGHGFCSDADVASRSHDHSSN